MKAYKIELLKKEFPFLNDFIKKGEFIDEIKVKRGDQNLLNQKGEEDSYSWSGGGHYDYTKYCAIFYDGSEWQIVDLDTAGKSGTGSGRNNEWDCDTIAEQLFAKDITSDFIVGNTFKDTNDNGDGQTFNSIVIYKMNKFDLVGHHKAQLDKAAAELKAEIEAACREPELQEA